MPEKEQEESEYQKALKEICDDAGLEINTENLEIVEEVLNKDWEEEYGF